MDLSNLGLVEHWLKLHIKLKALSFISSTGVLLGPRHGIADIAVITDIAVMLVPVKSQAQAMSLMEMVNRQYDDAQEKFEVVEDFLETDREMSELDDEREAMMLRVVEVTSLYTVWLEKANMVPAAVAAAGAVGGAAVGPVSHGLDRSFYSSMAGI